MSEFEVQMLAKLQAIEAAIIKLAAKFKIKSVGKKQSEAALRRPQLFFTTTSRLSLRLS